METGKIWKVLYVSAEAMPFAATGGLGDVMGALPAALAERGVDARVVLPLYGQIGEEVRNCLHFETCFYLNLSWRRCYCGIFSLKKGGVTYYFVDNERYFKRDEIYGYPDDGERFAFFCKAAVMLTKALSFLPHVLHANEWTGALSLFYLREKEDEFPAFRGVRTVFTVHNIEYQGVFPKEALGDVFGLSEGFLSALTFDGALNLMKGGIATADAITTVSPTYAAEITKGEGGLSPILRMRKEAVRGILNGIDEKSYNPAADSRIAAPFSRRKREGKSICKRALQQELSLAEAPQTPLFAVVSRLVRHKGMDLILAAAESILKEDLQLVILGRGDAFYEEAFRHLAEAHGEKVRAVLRYERDLARRVYAGADFFLMPSLSEPCGLSQMIASRYGAVPITRETGGLFDTIKPYFEKGGRRFGNGFTFYEASGDALADRVRAALSLYRQPQKYSLLQGRAMGMNFSWETSAAAYLHLYQNL